MESNIVRLKYVRTDEIKFVSHLDIVHVFERAIRRANLPIGFSNGFNPRMLLVFGNPLPVGLSSNAEFVDMEFTENVDLNKIIFALNEELPRALRIVSGFLLIKPYDNIVKAYIKAVYRVTLDGFDNRSFEEKVTLLMSSENPIEALKKSKNGDKTIDIRPMIYSVSCNENNVEITVACGQENNLKAELAITTLLEKTQVKGEIISICKIDTL